MSTASEIVLTNEFDSGLYEVILNLPDKRNALSFALIDNLSEKIETISSGNTRGALLCANGSHFSAGHDFNDLVHKGERDFEKLFDSSAALMASFSKLPFPVVSCVNGAAIGAGCQLALSTDLVIAAPDAYFQTPGGSRGWFCYSPMVELVRALPPKIAFELLCTGEGLSATRALEFGAINRISQTDLRAESRGFLRQVCRGDRNQIGRGKLDFYKIAGLSRAEALRLMASEMAETVTQEAPQKRIRSFLKC